MDKITLPARQRPARESSSAMEPRLAPPVPKLTKIATTKPDEIHSHNVKR